MSLPVPAQMARYTWTPTDDRWTVAGRFLVQSGYSTTSDLADAIRAANPLVISWRAVAPGSVVLVPLLTAPVAGA